MYGLVSALLKEKAPNSSYKKVDIRLVKMNTLIDKYSDGYIELSHPSLKKNIFVRLDSLYTSQYPINDLPFTQWLGNLRGQTIFGSTKRPVLNKQTVTFVDAIQADYMLSCIHPREIFEGNTYPVSELTDGYLFKSLKDVDLLHERVLTTVNGLLHLNVPLQNGLRIKDAGTTIKYSQDNHVGVISFEKIGRVKQLAFKREMLSEPHAIHGWRGGVYVDTGVNLNNKSVMMSLGGILYGLDGTITVVNTDGLIRLNLEKIDLVTLIQTIQSITPSLNEVLAEGRLRLNAINEDKIYTDNKVVEALLVNCLLSFLIIVDTPNLTKNFHAVNPVDVAWLKEIYQKPKLPYIADNGLIMSYWLTEHPTPTTNVYKLHLRDTFYRSPVQRTGLPVDRTLINKIDEITEVNYDIGRFLEITSENVEYFQ